MPTFGQPNGGATIIWLATDLKSLGQCEADRAAKLPARGTARIHRKLESFLCRTEDAPAGPIDAAKTPIVSNRGQAQSRVGE